MYAIEFTPKSEKIFLKLDPEVKERITVALERIRIRPHAFVKKLVESSYFRYRVWDYRIIMDIKKDKLIIFLIEITHRSTVYQ